MFCILTVLSKRCNLIQAGAGGVGVGVGTVFENG